MRELRHKSKNKLEVEISTEFISKNRSEFYKKKTPLTEKLLTKKDVEKFVRVKKFENSLELLATKCVSLQLKIKGNIF